MSRLIPSYEEQAARIKVLERAVISSEGDVERLERELAESVAAERERCAKIVEQYTGAWDDKGFALAAKIRKGE